MNQAMVPSVLVVDDDNALTALVERLLSREKIRTHAVYSGLEAAEWVKSNKADLMVLDYSLPDMTGERLVELLREEGNLPPFLVVTGRGDEQVAVSMMKQGARDYLMKDASLLEFLPSVVHQALEHIRQERRLVEAEDQLRGMYEQLQKNRDDLRSILDSLRIGTLVMDEDGRVDFASSHSEDILKRPRQDLLGHRWQEALPFSEKYKWQLTEMSHLPAERREKLSVSASAPNGESYWVDIEIKDDPYNSERRIFFLYDTSEVHQLRLMLDEKTHFSDLIGKSDRMRQVVERLQEVATVDATVLIQGETGTGKEMVARAIHFCGHRQGGPFIAVNCAGLTDSLLESQLFGHKRGAFTGAVQDHRGFFEEANGGTLFLDEIGDIPVNVQTRLLRVLQEREIMRVGESQPRKVDVRVVVATQHDLEHEVSEGRFRRDLFYRVRVATIQLPPLRERREDIPLLARVFLRRYASVTGKRIEDVGNEAMGALMDHDWPGNVRELQNAIESAVIRCKGLQIQLSDLNPEIARLRGRPSFAEMGAFLSPEDEKTRIVDALRAARGNRSRAAKLLGISRATLYRRFTTLNFTDAES